MCRARRSFTLQVSSVLHTAAHQRSEEADYEAASDRD
jgi:hypothetical protein